MSADDKSVLDADLYKIAAETASDVIIIIDIRSKIVYCNAAIERLLGYTPEELIGGDLTTLMPESARSRHLKGISSFLRTNQRTIPWDGVELTARHKNGRDIPIEVSFGIVRRADERHLFCGVVRDVAARKRTEDVVGAIAKQTSAATGDIFFRKLVTQLAETLECRYAFVGKVTDTATESVQTTAVCVDGEITDNFAYQLKDTPCANVLNGEMCIHASKVQADFPADELLVTMGVDAYAGTPLIDSTGRSIGLLVVLNDRPFANRNLTVSLLQVFASRAAAELERTKAEEALRDSEEKYRSLVETSQDLIWSVDAEGRWTFINQAAKRILGYEPDEMLGRPFKEFEPPEQVERDLEVFEQIKAGQPYFSYETTHLRKDGSPVILSFNAVALQNSQGEVIGTTGTAADITERKRAEQALRLTQYAVDMSDSSIFWIRPDSSLYYVNDAACRSLGYDRAELLAMSVPDFDPNWTLDYWLREGWNRVRDAGSSSFQSTHRRKDGNDFPVEVMANFTQYEGEEYIFAFVRDITERKRADDRQRLMMAELDHRVKNTLAAVIALAEQTTAHADSLEDFSATYLARLRSLARTHEALAASKWSGIELQEAVRLLVLPYVSPEDKRLVVTGENVRFSAEAASPICMTLHELTTNAVKYGALSEHGGRLDISWTIEDNGSVLFSWRESNGPKVRAPRNPGLGMVLIRGFIEHELRGGVDIDFAPEGFRCTLTIPSSAEYDAATAD